MLPAKKPRMDEKGAKPRNSRIKTKSGESVLKIGLFVRLPL